MSALAKTLPPPAKRCAICGAVTSLPEWIAHPRRRYWPGLGIEISEPCCTNTLTMPINAEPAVVR